MPVRSKKKKELKEQGYVFEATGKSVSEIHTEELVGKTVEFDAHDVTAKIMEFGKVLTGISLYSYFGKMRYGSVAAMPVHGVRPEFCHAHGCTPVVLMRF